MPSLEANDFSVVFTRALGSVVVKVSGELDIHTAPELTGHLDDIILDQGNRDVVVDLRDVSFIDSSGITALVRASRKLTGHGGVLRISAPSDRVMKVLEMTGAAKTLTITRT